MNFTKVLLTDPAVVGVTEDGDVDDTGCGIHLAQLFRDEVLFVICGNRFDPYMHSIGNQLRVLYGCTFIREEELTLPLQEYASVYVHSPTKASSAAWMEQNLKHIVAIYRQGDDLSVNFNHSPEMRELLERPNVARYVTLYRTQETEFTIPYEESVHQSLTGLAKETYESYFKFAFRKNFGTAMHLPYCDRLYSNTGKNGTPGNGTLKFIPLIQRLPHLVLSDTLETALQNTIRSSDPSSLVNLRNIVGVLQLYCDYESLIVDGKLPNMGNLKPLDDVTKWETCPDFVKEFFESAGRTSTPLFDFASGYWSTMGYCSRSVLQYAVVASLKQLSWDQYEFDIVGSVDCDT